MPGSDWMKADSDLVGLTYAFLTKRNRRGCKNCTAHSQYFLTNSICIEFAENIEFTPHKTQHRSSLPKISSLYPLSLAVTVWLKPQSLTENVSAAKNFSILQNVHLFVVDKQ